jgi:CDGSH-type Zn-finger protein
MAAGNVCVGCGSATRDSLPTGHRRPHFAERTIRKVHSPLRRDRKPEHCCLTATRNQSAAGRSEVVARSMRDSLRSVLGLFRLQFVSSEMAAWRHLQERVLPAGRHCSTAASAQPKLPIATASAPFKVDVTAGKAYFWCSCGLSKKQPLCDGAHKSTTFKPIKFVAVADEPVWMCGCKQTKTAPLCDGSHQAPLHGAAAALE